MHEAAHAVIGRRMGWLCGSVTIIPKGNLLGFCESASPWETLEAWQRTGRPRRLRSILLGKMISWMAGAAAEQLFLGSARYAIDDMMNVEEVAAEYFPDLGFDHLYDRLSPMTDYLVRHHESLIRQVACRLTERGTIDSLEANSLIGSKIGAYLPA